MSIERQDLTDALARRVEIMEQNSKLVQETIAPGLEAAKQNAKRMQETIAPALEAIEQNAKRFQETITPAVEAALQNAKRMQEIVGKFTASIDLSVIARAIDVAKSAAQAMSEWMSAERECRVILKEYQWLLTYETHASIVFDISKTNAVTREAELDEIFMSVIEEDDYRVLRMIEDEIYQSPKMSRFGDTVRIAIELFHKSGVDKKPNYHRLIIPSLIPVIDNVYTELAKLKFADIPEYRSILELEDKMVLANSNKFEKHNYHIILKEHEQRREKLVKNAIYWLGAPDFITSLFDKSVLDHRFMNRNAILHGRRADFANRQNSARLLLLLKFLLELEQDLPSLEIRENPPLTPWEEVRALSKLRTHS